MLVYRLVNYLIPLPDIDIGLQGRDKELCKRLLQLFWNSKDGEIRSEIGYALEQFLKKKNQNKMNMLEAAIAPIIANLLSVHGIDLRASLIWQSIRDSIEGTYDGERKPNEYQTADFGTIYRNTITNTICDKFGAEKKRTNKGSVLLFDIDKFLRACKAYGLYEDDRVIGIQTKLDDEGSEGSDSSDGSTRKGTIFYNDSINDKSNPVYENGTKHDSEIMITAEKGTVETHKERSNEPTLSEEPSQPSLPSLLPAIEISSIPGIQRAALNNLAYTLHIVGMSSTNNTANKIDQHHLVAKSKSIFRIGKSDNWACTYCTLKGDIHYMKEHLCRGAKIKESLIRK